MFFLSLENIQLLDQKYLVYSIKLVYSLLLKMAFDKGNTRLSEERLITLIREVFREKCEKQ